MRTLRYNLYLTIEVSHRGSFTEVQQNGEWRLSRSRHSVSWRYLNMEVSHRGLTGGFIYSSPEVGIPSAGGI
jgi:hypothetical protein